MAEFQQIIDTAASLAAVGRYDEATEVLASLAEGASTAEALLLGARIAAQQRKYAEAESLCKRLCELSLQPPEAQQVSELRDALRAVNTRSGDPFRTRLVLAGSTLALVLVAGVAYFAGHNIGVAQTRGQLAERGGQQQGDRATGPERFEARLQGLTTENGKLERALARIEEQLGNNAIKVEESFTRAEDMQADTRRTFERRFQRLDRRLRAMESHASAASTQ